MDRLSEILVIVAFSVAASATATSSVEEGADLFPIYCASCHGQGGRGDGPVAANLLTPPTDLTRLAERHGGRFPSARVGLIIDGRRDVRGHSNADMPVWGLTFRQRDAAWGQEASVGGRIGSLVAFLETIQRPRSVTPVAEESRKVESPPDASTMPGPPARGTPMRGFASVFEEILPYLGDDESFADRSQAVAIGAALERLEELTNPESHLEPFRSTDLRLTLDVLRDLVTRARQLYEHGETSRARDILQWSVGLCASCHSRLPEAGGGLPSPAMVRAHVKDPFERARWAFAFRSFDDALVQFEALIAGYPGNQMPRYLLEDALDYVTAIWVRVRHDPASAATALRVVAERDDLPGLVRRDSASAVESLERWMGEPTIDVATTSDETVIAEARRILGREALEPTFRRDRRRQVDFLRASGLLHELLYTRPASKLAGEAEYLLGICYLSLDVTAYVGFDAAYFEACIRRDPAAAVAGRCLEMLEQSVYFGFTGSSGTNIPDEVQGNLDELRELIEQARPDATAPVEK